MIYDGQVPPGKKTKQLGPHSRVQVCSEMMHWRSSVYGYLVLSFTAKCEIQNEILQAVSRPRDLSLRDHLDGCPVSTPIAAW